MELRQLHYFMKVAQKQHVTQASEELHIAQSAVSRQIHQLEEELGVSLFIQRGRNVQLTPVGQLFCERVQAIIQDLDNAVYEVRQLVDPEYGEIRIGFPHSLGIHVIPSVVAAFRKCYPNVRFKFKQGMFSTLMKDVLCTEVDLAFISPFPQNQQHVSGHIVLTEELVAILPISHPLAGHSSITLAQLREDEFILFREGYSLRSIVWDACLDAGFTPSIAFEGEETDAIRGLVAAGMGVSLLPEMAMAYVQSLDIVKVKITQPRITRTIGLIHRAHEKLPVVAETFRSFLLSYFEVSVYESTPNG